MFYFSSKSRGLVGGWFEVVQLLVALGSADDRRIDYVWSKDSRQMVVICEDCR